MKRVLVVLPNWFGEALFATPLLSALKQGLPKTEIIAMAWPQCEPVLRHHPAVDSFLPYEEVQGLFGLSALYRGVAQVRALAADAALILRKSFSRTLVLKLAGIPMRVGFAHPKVRGLLTHAVAGPAERTHKADTYLPLLHPFGIVAQPQPYSYCITDDERKAAGAWMQPPGMKPQRWVIVHPGANWLHKRWKKKGTHART